MGVTKPYKFIGFGDIHGHAKSLFIMPEHDPEDLCLFCARGDTRQTTIPSRRRMYAGAPVPRLTTHVRLHTRDPCITGSPQYPWTRHPRARQTRDPGCSEGTQKVDPGSPAKLTFSDSRHVAGQFPLPLAKLSGT